MTHAGRAMQARQQQKKSAASRHTAHATPLSYSILPAWLCTHLPGRALGADEADVIRLGWLMESDVLT
jgi:hypothetical protein